MKKISQIFLFSIALLFIYIPSSYAVYTGAVTGKLRFFNKLGHYCANDGRDCSDAKYKQADFSKYQPLREVRVKIYVNGQLAGFGSTDKYGKYAIQYTSTLVPTTLKLVTNLQHKDNRFQVRGGNGAEYTMWGWATPTIGSSFWNPQNLGTWNWGTSASPIDAANTYNGAWRTWHYAFKYSAHLRNHFHGLDIYNNVPVNGSFFTGSPFRVRIATAAQYVYGTIYHELGHAASYKASKGQSFMGHTGYCYPNTTCSDGSHSFKTQEWANPQFEEGLATFLGQVGSFWSVNSDPIHCLGNGQNKCPSVDTPNSFDMETSSGSACTTADRRYELNTTKYLRDLYDSNDVVDLNFSQMVHGINAFNDHDNNRGKNEHWDIGWFWDSIDDYDGRSTKDYQYHVEGLYNISPTNSNFLYTFNCNPAGD